MNTHQTTQENPIPLIKPQPPLPILIKETKFDYAPSDYYPGQFNFFVKAGMLGLMFEDLKIEQAVKGSDNRWIVGIYKGETTHFIDSINIDEANLLSMWIDRCKGVTL